MSFGVGAGGCAPQRVNGEIPRYMCPAPPAWHVSRPRLLRRLDAAGGRPLTVVLGPPGSGKTVLLSGWAEAHAGDAPVVWATLGRSDRLPVHFLTTVFTCLGHLEPALREVGPIAARGDRGDAGVGAEARRLLAGLPESVVILDGFHAAASPQTAAATRRLSGMLPPRARLVVASRSRRDLALPAGPPPEGVAEVGGGELAFDLGEAADLVALLAGRRLRHGDLHLLVEEMEGWAAGLRMAAQRLRTEADPTWFARHFDGGSEPVAGYLHAEVLGREPADRRAFLLDTSVLESLDAGLCGAVTGRADAGAVLEALAAGNMFVLAESPGAGDARARYRYHSVLAALLRRDLAAVPQRRSRLLRRAAGWYRHHGQPRRAATALSGSGQHDEAVEVMGAVLARGLEAGIPAPGDATTVDLDLPPDHALHDPWAAYALAAAYLCSFSPAQARPWLLRLEGAVASGAAEALSSRTQVLWTVYDAQRSEARGVMDRCSAASHLAGNGVAAPPLPPAPATRYPWLRGAEAARPALVASLMARASVWNGDFAAARAALGARPPAAVGVPPALGALQEALVAMADCGEGLLTQAAGGARHALARIAEAGGWVPAAAIGAHQVLATVERDRDRLEPAAAELDEALLLAERVPYPRPWVADVEMDRFWVWRALGRHGEASDALARVRLSDTYERLPEHLRRRLVSAEVRSRLDAGDVRAAAAFLEVTPPEHRSVGLLARFDLRAGRPDRAVRRLEAPGDTVPLLRFEIERLVLLARAQFECGDRRAESTMLRAVEMAGGEGYVRVFVEEGDTARALLERVAALHPDLRVDRLLARVGAGGGTPGRVPAPSVLEPLTDREREVLGYLPTHLSQHQIAAEMYVSVNTLKTHLKGIYRKLGAVSRADAVRAARAHGLL